MKNNSFIVVAVIDFGSSASAWLEIFGVCEHFHRFPFKINRKVKFSHAMTLTSIDMRYLLLTLAIQGLEGF